MNELIKNGKTALGIELGSTRIKAVLIDLEGNVLAVGFHDWENSLVDGLWTYSLEEIHAGLRSCYSSLRESVAEKYGLTLTRVGAIGISSMTGRIRWWTECGPTVRMRYLRALRMPMQILKRRWQISMARPSPL